MRTNARSTIANKRLHSQVESDYKRVHRGPRMFDLLHPIFDFFLALLAADKRPDARRFTIGCFLMVVVFIGLLALIFWNVDTGPPK
jgi:hypothetical protein